MRRIVGLAVAAVLVVPAAADATIDHCPAGVSEVRGTQPTYAQIAGWLATSADAHDVPVQVLKAIAYRESLWKQFNADGTVVVSSDAVCGLGIMQVTADDRADAVLLASDPAYNIDEGAGILAEKWAISQETQPPTDYPADDPHAIENWYYAACLYNGCGTDPAYPERIAQLVADPWRRVEVAGIRPYMPIGGFTSPFEADPSYTFPSAFQARLAEQDFVFYDHVNGDVTSTVSKPIHDDRSAPPVVAYAPGAFGPDGPGVTCTVCGGWRLAEGLGDAGRAHWTKTVTGAEGTRVTWQPTLPRTGPYHVFASVPLVGTEAEPLGTATYHVGPSATAVVDQGTPGPTWRSLGTHTLGTGSTVWLNDVSSVAGERLAADGMLFAKAPALSLASSASTTTYGTAVTLTMRLTHAGVGLGGRAIRLDRRKVGTTAWTQVGTWTNASNGTLVLTARPSYNSEYRARFISAETDTVDATSAARRVNVRTLVKASLSRTPVPRNTAVTVSASVAPSHAGQVVYLQRYVNGAWQSSLSKTLNASSAAAFTFAKNTAGTYVYRVYKPADADHVASWSATLTLKVT